MIKQKNTTQFKKDHHHQKQQVKCQWKIGSEKGRFYVGGVLNIDWIIIPH